MRLCPNTIRNQNFKLIRINYIREVITCRYSFNKVTFISVCVWCPILYVEAMPFKFIFIEFSFILELIIKIFGYLQSFPTFFPLLARPLVFIIIFCYCYRRSMRFIILETTNYFYSWSYQCSLSMSLILFILSFIIFQFWFEYAKSRFLSQFKLSFVCRAIRIKYFSFSNKFIFLKGAINNSSISKF